MPRCAHGPCGFAWGFSTPPKENSLPCRRAFTAVLLSNSFSRTGPERWLKAIKGFLCLDRWVSYVLKDNTLSATQVFCRASRESRRLNEWNVESGRLIACAHDFDRGIQDALKTVSMCHVKKSEFGRSDFDCGSAIIVPARS
jgi:hypothetical protein